MPVPEHVYLTAAAAVWGILAGGFLLPRPAHRLAVEPDEPWRDRDPDGRPFPAGPRGWAGRGPGAVTLAVLCAAAGAALALRVGTRPELAVWLLLVPAGVLMARVDLAVFRLPDVLTLPAGAAVVVLLGACALLPRAAGSWPRALLGGAALFGFYFLLHFINPAGMGFGDVKLAPAVGMALGWYGWWAVFVGTFAGFALGAAVALGLMALRRIDRRTAVPFGPFMLLGALGGVLLAAG
ncbi:prepilin peptidase [Streptomyces sp. NBC_01262]|uniref:prepilin peptidase n=1 Tax=Streptomyces sp. NBC_01262 TaxID=2903803 RepID=UPI002E325BBC|nr:A24 family peptidase [Streptomyces sp. NBC_01262]